ncbi:MAG: bifunctional 2-C-methyl-D-erythritol 4-phosphate cytidylyltransferase/2-C-methyl-D-erythritol 2,4-cyclodiphosphate synthase [Alphaproteobacteria bacterium]
MSKRIALIVAAGRGTRFGGTLPKQYADLAGVAVIRRATLAFLRHPDIARVRCVIHPDDQRAYDTALGDLGLLSPVHGGPTRQESVRLGLESLADESPDLVLIHDGARPLVTAALVSRTIQAAERHGAAIAAVAVSDTLKRGGPLVTATVDRTGLWRAQTPQAFGYGTIVAAHRAHAGADLPDDAAVAERAGIAVALAEGSDDNMKVTGPDDLDRARRLLDGRATSHRVGQGFDVHRLGPGDGVMLGGVHIAHDGSLIGHSDADVVLHALTDAILGGLGDGDIGSHFPPSEARWRGADSAIFVMHAASLVRERGGTIEHADVTILCERPKIGPHRAAMTARIAALLGLPPARVGVKATTTEGLGFTGRGEGIAAQAVATLRLPPNG